MDARVFCVELRCSKWLLSFPKVAHELVQYVVIMMFRLVEPVDSRVVTEYM